MESDKLNHILIDIIKSELEIDDTSALNGNSYIINDLGIPQYFFDDFIGDFYEKISDALNTNISIDDFVSIGLIPNSYDIDNFDITLYDLSKAIKKIIENSNTINNSHDLKFETILEGKSMTYWVDRLVKSKDLYINSPLGQWDDRNKLKFLTALSIIREKFPQNCEEFCDYIFSTSQISFGDLVDISSKSIQNKTLDRKSSMIGGLPWTDDKHPWPESYDIDNNKIALAPIGQVNLREVSAITGINFPDIIIQLWGEDHIRHLEIEDLSCPEWTTPEHIGNGYGVYYEYELAGHAIKIGKTSISCDAKCADSILSNSLTKEYEFDDDGDIINDNQIIEGDTELFEKLHEFVYEIENEIQGQVIFPNPKNYNDTYSTYTKNGWRILIGGHNWSLYYRLIDGEYEFTSTYSPS
ncbi:hypothetical protein [Brevundimonas sp.]|uniref:hypothetical protein n=1 Tax=Brevundimonas sp. TaxID=1871086 RepID=UPI00289A8076|nr:hypothetical protein [Brevundimonas sp.]